MIALGLIALATVPAVFLRKAAPRELVLPSPGSVGTPVPPPTSTRREEEQGISAERAQKGLATAREKQRAEQQRRAEEERRAREQRGAWRSTTVQPPAQPGFPWPPPAASASEVLPRKLLDQKQQIRELRDLDAVLTSALDANGYYERSYYAVPLGFVLVTRLEQIEPDGKPKTAPARWLSGPQAPSVFSLVSYLRALFTAEPGYYRLIVFVVTSSPFAPERREVNSDEALGWLRSGLNTLPDAIGMQAYSPEVASTALVYEFERRAGTDPASTRILLPSRLDCHTHLVNSGLWRTLEGS